MCVTAGIFLCNGLASTAIAPTQNVRRSHRAGQVCTRARAYVCVLLLDPPPHDDGRAADAEASSHEKGDLRARARGFHAKLQLLSNIHVFGNIYCNWCARRTQTARHAVGNRDSFAARVVVSCSRLAMACVGTRWWSMPQHTHTYATRSRVVSSVIIAYLCLLSVCVCA